MKKLHWLLRNLQILLPGAYVVCQFTNIFILPNLLPRSDIDLIGTLAFYLLHFPVLLLITKLPFDPKFSFYHGYYRGYPARFDELMIISVVYYFFLGLILTYVIQFFSQASKKPKRKS